MPILTYGVFYFIIVAERIDFMNFTIDRFEGGFAVVESENGLFLNIPRELLPEDSAEGDVFSLTKNVTETEIRKKRIESLMNDLFE